MNSNNNGQDNYRVIEIVFISYDFVNIYKKSYNYIKFYYYIILHCEENEMRRERFINIDQKKLQSQHRIFERKYKHEKITNI